MKWLKRIKLFCGYFKYIGLVILGVIAGIFTMSLFRKNSGSEKGKINELKKDVKKSIDFNRDWLSKHKRRRVIRAEDIY